MSGAVEAEAPRPRPLSGGLWTLFSWLRREERSSSESLSSAGSDRTAASFAFLAPAHYGSAPPALLPPPPPPTDSYRKRVRDRNARRQHERDITLHRKYGLYGFGYEAQSLPRAAAAPPRDRCARDRRAASECPRAHVPGKRRAPPPPATLDTRRARKRPAPPPPVRPLADTNEQNNVKKDVEDVVPMNRLPLRDERPSQNNDDATGCKPEKYSKKDARAKETKDVKLRHEKSFLKQIFDNRKRNSAIEPASVKLLPSISELDKQAAEIIEKYRLKEMPHYDDDKATSSQESPGSSKLQKEAWICTMCLRKYNATVITCNYCMPLNKANDSFKSSKLSNHSTQTASVPGSSKSKAEDKEKLKEMLKEMKDSLPKRPKSDMQSSINSNKPKNFTENEDYPKTVEAPTLRIGTSISVEVNPSSAPESSNTNQVHKNLSSGKVVLQDNKKEINHNVNSGVASKSHNDGVANKLVSQDLHKESKERKIIVSNLQGNSSEQGSSSSKHVPNENIKELTSIHSVLITQPVVLMHTKSNIVSNKDNVIVEEPVVPIKKNMDTSISDSKSENFIQLEKVKQNNEPKSLNVMSKAKYDLNTPLKISSLLNPIYIPKCTTSTNTQVPTVVQRMNIVQVKKENSTDPVSSSINISNTDVNAPEPSVSQIKVTASKLPSIKESKHLSETKITSEYKESISNEKTTQAKTENNNPHNANEKFNNNVVTDLYPLKDKPSTSVHATNGEGRLDQHARKRDLINKLERSIATGDEQSAAEAAVKLAQLRLSCSVLSFSSQIVAGASTSVADQSNTSKSVIDTKNKVEDAVQKKTPNKTEPVKVDIKVTNNKDKALPTKKENILTENVVVKTEPILPTTENENKTKSKLKTKDTHTNTNNQNILLSKASTSKGKVNENVNEDVPILVWVEDKEATRGPVQIHVRRNAVMGDLRKQAEESLGLPARMQRWIVGKSLCTDDNTPLVTLAGLELTAPFYLCLVESESKEIAKPNINLKTYDDAGNVYNELVKLEQQAIVANAEVFECGVCIEQCPPGRGVVLRECIHSFCRECLSDVVRHSAEPIVGCPAMGCSGVLQEREVRGLVSPEDYEKWLARGLAAAESGTRNAFHCRTRDCTGWALCDPGVRRFPCPVCKRTNCLPCRAIHEGETCDEHRAKIQTSAESANASQTDEGTEALLKTLISRGEALECPECSAIITKKWGCDWVKCSACKTEICWVTRGRRWGPAGRGDTSAGCRCGVDGKRCHPSCGYCH